MAGAVPRPARGASPRQRAVANAQRGAKAQPGIGSRSDGTMPGISLQPAARRRRARRRGIEAIRPRV